MATEIVKKAFAEVKMDAKVSWQPWARGFEETKTGGFAGTFPYIKNEERLKDFLYSDVLLKIQSVGFVKASNSKKYNFADPASLAGTNICLPLGWNAPKALDTLIKSGQIKTAAPKDISTCVKMVEAGRADYYVTDEAQGLAAIKSSGVSDGAVVLAAGAPVADDSLYLIAGKGTANSKETIAAFNKGLDSLRKSGAFDKIVKSHSK